MGALAGRDAKDATHERDLLHPSEVPRAAWRALVESSRSSDPKLLPEVALDAGGHTREAPLLFWRGHEQAAHALAVLERRRARLARVPGLGRLTTLRALRVVGNDIFGEVEREECERFVEAVCTLLAAGRAECVLFEDLATDSPLASPIEKAGRQGRIALFSPGPPQPHWYVRFPSPASDYWKVLSGKARYKLRRKARAFDHHLLRITDKADVGEFLEKARRVSENSWQASRFGVRIRTTPEAIREAEALAEAGAFRSYLLEHDDGTPLAFVLGFQWRGRFFHEETGYDMRYGELSPGVVLQYRLLEDLIAHDTPELLDFGAGDAEYKRSFGNLWTESGRVVLVRPSGRPLAAYHLAGAWMRSERAARSLLRRAGVYERARRLYRGRH